MAKGSKVNAKIWVLKEVRQPKIIKPKENENDGETIVFSAFGRPWNNLRLNYLLCSCFLFCIFKDFAAVIMRISVQKTTALAFDYGKMVINEDAQGWF